MRQLSLYPTPQDLLWPQLTAWETLDLFAAIKGVAAGIGRDEEVTRVLQVRAAEADLFFRYTMNKLLYNFYRSFVIAMLPTLPRFEFPSLLPLISLQEVRLMPVAHRAVGTFSGGMKRRVSVAIAALGSPAVIYLDEPTTGECYA